MKTLTRRAFLASLLALALATAPATGQDRPDPDGSSQRASADGKIQARDGKAIYEQVCQGCHMPEGRGAAGAGSYPALARNPNTASAPYLAMTILKGRRNMPSFALDRNQELFVSQSWMDDEQVAMVVNYLRTNLGNNYPDPIRAADVTALRVPNGDLR
jgi:mono/diheme cytochrome c family protein